VQTTALPDRDRLLVLLALGLVVALAWAYLFAHAAHMTMEAAGHAIMGMTGVPWSVSHFALTASMWAVMMAAMMLPSATPMILTYATLVRRMRRDRDGHPEIAIFVLGYLLVWCAFSVLATALQWGLEHLALLSPMLVSSSHRLGGGLLLIAGLYQLLPVKEFCLKHCQSPFQFLTRRWRSGRTGALSMGLMHGAYCVGCCWALMLLLFVGGVMNLLWVALIAAFVLLEKVIPRSWTFGRWISGGGLLAAGLLLFSGAGHI
jgi:predicted metal-binding membrane protein